MANEITITTGLEVNGGGLVDKFQPGGSFNLDQTNARSKAGVQAIATSAENLDEGDLTDGGMICIKNLDDTNFVEFGVDNTGFVACGKIRPGKQALFEIADSTTLQLKADTDACDVQVLILDK